MVIDDNGSFGFEIDSPDTAALNMRWDARRGLLCVDWHKLMDAYCTQLRKVEKDKELYDSETWKATRESGVWAVTLLICCAAYFLGAYVLEVFVVAKEGLGMTIWMGVMAFALALLECVGCIGSDRGRRI